jgi:hypothetical protein
MSSTIFLSSNEAQEGKIINKHPIQLCESLLSVVDALWNGELVQVNNKNNDIDCEQHMSHIELIFERENRCTSL